MKNGYVSRLSGGPGLRLRRPGLKHLRNEANGAAAVAKPFHAESLRRCALTSHSRTHATAETGHDHCLDVLNSHGAASSQTVGIFR